MRAVLVLVAALLAAALVPPTYAQAPAGHVRIGVVDDQSGIYSAVTGRGTVEAVRLAVEDAGGRVLGLPVEVLSADDQMKPEVSAGVARKWIDVDGVDAILSGSGSATAMAVLQITRDKDKTLLLSGPGSSDFTGKLCAITSTHWAFDSYGLASTVARAVVADGGTSWFFVTADYTFGHTLERDATRLITGGGGKVVGSVSVPLGTTDYSSYLASARASGAGVIGLANAGNDLVNAIKQAHEFAIPQGGQRLAGLLLYVNDIQALGLATAAGTVGATSFYHDQSEATRAWTARYMARYPGHIPNMLQAGAYASVLHYLKAVAAAGTTEAKAVGEKMRALPVNDFYDHDVHIRRDGRVLQGMMLWRAKTPAESTGPNDLLAITRTLPGAAVYRPESEGGCPLVAQGRE